MKISFSPLNESSAFEIAQWQYEPPYEVYNLDDDKETIDYVLSPQWNFFAMRDTQENLIGFCSFGKDGQVPGGDYNLEALDIGMGIHPDLTDRGRGAEYVSAVIDFSRETFNSKCFRVTIAQFNRRAQKVWERNGFHLIQQFNHEESGKSFMVYIFNETEDCRLDKF